MDEIDQRTRKYGQKIYIKFDLLFDAVWVFLPLYSLIINNIILNHHRPYFDSYFHAKIQSNANKFLYEVGFYESAYRIYDFSLLLFRIGQSRINPPNFDPCENIYIFFFSKIRWANICLSNCQRMQSAFIHSVCSSLEKKADYTNSSKALAYEPKTKNTRNVSRRLPRWGWYKIMNLSGRLFHNGTHTRRERKKMDTDRLTDS